MTIGKKLLLGYGAALALLLVVTAVAVGALQETRNAYGEILGAGARAVDEATAIGESVRDQVIEYRGALLLPDRRDRFVANLRDSRAAFTTAIDAARTSLSGGPGRERLDQLIRLQAAFEEAQDRNLAASRESVNAYNADDVAALSQRLIDESDRFRDERLVAVADQRASLERRMAFISAAMMLVAAVAVVLGLLLAVLVGRGITRQLQESAGVLSSSAAQILATTTQLSSGAAETDTAVSETTTTVEEVKQTAQLASQKARQVLDSAQRAASTSEAGRKAVDDMIDTMSEIKAQMDAIAGATVRLSEQGNAIGEIIAVVADLAEQSNILAVNAAIEATRAGEHGKGFGVVAQEVKSLAEQSKQATAQVRTILGDVQKATHSAVLATEQGHKAVDVGVHRSSAAGEVIGTLADTAGGAADAATQIAASSQQQMVGMDQVALAMENIKQASTQNAAGARQAEVAARELHDVGRRLLALVGGAGR